MNMPLHTAAENGNPKRKALIAALRDLAGRERGALAAQQNEALRLLERQDLLWYLLLQSLATWGRGGGWDGLIGNPANYSRVTFDAVGELPVEERAEKLAEVFCEAGVRYHNIKGRCLAACYERVAELGGPEQATRYFLELQDRAQIIRFLGGFKGIGPKYVRNIPMDIYHPAFRDAIALDARIQRISRALGLPYGPRDYEPHEAWYLAVGREVGLSGWEMDRLLYAHYKEILAAIESNH